MEKFYNVKAKIKVNKIGLGGRDIIRSKDSEWHAFQIFIDEKYWDARVLLPSNKIFFNDIEYIVNIAFINKTEIASKIHPGEKIKIREGILWDNDFWATGEILEISDEESVDK